jgi:hypothetical protein
MDPILYSQVPAGERADWSDDELSGAMWDEAVQLAGGYGFQPSDLDKLPFGYRAVLAEGVMRAHIEGDGIPTCVWNDDGTAYFRAAAACHERLGNGDLAALLREIDSLQAAWERDTGNKCRDLEWQEFVKSPHGEALAAFQEPFEALAEEGFSRMMRELRARPDLFADQGRPGSVS